MYTCSMRIEDSHFKVKSVSDLSNEYASLNDAVTGR